MIKAFYISKGGAQNYQYSLDAIANNIANVNTPGYKSEKVTFSELLYNDTEGLEGNNLTGNGSRVSVSKDMTEGNIVENDDGTGLVELSNVDLIAEMANMINAQRGFQLNAKMIQTADEMEQYANNLT